MSLRANAFLLLRGMRWRLGISLLTVLTSVIAVHLVLATCRAGVAASAN